MAVSQNRYPVDPKVERIRIAKDWADVRAGVVADIFRYLGEQYHRRVEPVSTFNGYRSAAANKATGTPVSNSNHRSATAVDINGAKYPYEYAVRQRGGRYADNFKSAHVKEINEILKELGGTITWGRNFASPYRDPMHYEITRGTPSAKINEIAKLCRKTFRAGGQLYHTNRSTNVYAGTTGKKKVKRAANFQIRPVAFQIWDGRVWAVTKYGNLYLLSHLTKGAAVKTTSYRIDVGKGRNLNVRTGPSDESKIKAVHPNGKVVKIAKIVSGDGRKWGVTVQGGHYALDFLKKV